MNDMQNFQDQNGNNQGDDNAQGQDMTNQGFVGGQGQTPVDNNQQLGVDPNNGIPQAQVVNPGQQGAGTTQGDDGQQSEQKVNLTEEELASFDMRDFDQNLRPDLGNLASDSLGQALGTTGDAAAGAAMTSSEQYDDMINSVIPAHNLNFDETLFKSLLAGSISLLYNEKKAIITQIPKLSQTQIDELIKILNEEKKKFAELNKKHKDELKKIEEKHDHSEEKEILQAEENQSKEGDQAAAEELLRKLQGGN